MNMISRLRWKFVAINMLIVTVIMTCVCVTIGVTTQDNLRQDSLALLNRVISQKNQSYFFEQDRDSQSIYSFFSGEDTDVALPYFTVVLGMDGTAVITDSQFYDLSDENLLIEIVNACMEQPSSSGVLEQYGLRYLRTDSLFGWRMAFSDISQERSTLHQMMGTLLLVAVLALVALFFISILLARWAVRPVERTWKQQRQFVADASHELKTPLTVVLSNVEMLQRYTAGLTDREQRWLENIRGSSQQMQELVEALLVLARSDNMVADSLRAEKVNLSDLVMDAVLLFEPTVFEAGKVLEDDVDDDLYVSGDPAKLRRLMEILLDNARKYACDGGRILVSLKPEGSKRICLCVFNEGEPMSREQLEHIFERFYRGDKARTTEGFGLGLSIAERTVEEHHGTIRASSDDRGNTFRVSLPVYKEHAPLLTDGKTREKK